MFFKFKYFFNLKLKILSFNLSADNKLLIDCLIKVFYLGSFIEM